ncbi:MAG: universal stress protein [Chloroflexota bacterium]|jgi:nucleotide-binding universal stress UspA family protein
MSEILIATNGYKETRRAIEYGVWLAKNMRMKITLLGVTERLSPAAIDDHHPLEDIFEEAVGLFREQGVEYSLEVQNGEAEEVIPQKANRGDYITVVSPLGRPPIRRWLTGRSIRPLMEKIKTPILYVPQTRLPLKRMLVSIGGLEYIESAESLAFQIAAACRAEVAILHVVPPADLDYPSAREVWKHADDLIETDTLPGRSLRKGLELARQAGLTAHAVTRKGDVVEEILAEIKEGDYDMVCMGSPYSAHSLRQLYAPNVTADVAEVAPCPVLTARYKPVGRD